MQLFLSIRLLAHGQSWADITDSEDELELMNADIDDIEVHFFQNGQIFLYCLSRKHRLITNELHAKCKNVFDFRSNLKLFLL